MVSMLQQKKEFSIDVENGFEPTYEIPADKKKLVAELKAEAKKADMVWLASDEDREGEAISWHLFEVLGLDPEKTKRIVFHEITKTAILKAIENPRDIDVNLVNAQQARRILDRIVGFELSPVLWKKVKPALSAGRVQSVAVRLIVEREREVHAFVSEPSYRVTAVFEVPDVDGNEVEVKGKKLHSLLTNARCYVLPSSHEGLPIALLEAMSYRLPVIVSDIPANKEMGLDASCYFETGNIEQLADRLQEIIDGDFKQVHYDMEKYGWDGIALRVADVYENLKK